MTIQSMIRQCMRLVGALVLASASACTARSISEPDQIQEGFVSVGGGVRLFYRLYGSGPDTLVLLHGGPGANFMGVGPDLLPLARAHKLLLYDQRGGGRSDPDPNAKDITVSIHVHDLETLRRHFGLDRMTLIGHSWGSVLAAFYAEEHPGHVARLILVGPMEPTWSLLQQREQALAGKDPEGEVEMARLAQRPDLSEDPIALCRAQFALIQRRYYHDSSKMSRKLGDYCDVPPDAPARGDVVEQATDKSLGKYDLRPLLANLKMPVLVVEGAQTPIPLEGYREWARSCANARLWLIDQVGHAYPFVEAPEVFFPGVERFLQGDWPTGSVSVEH